MAINELKENASKQEESYKQLSTKVDDLKNEATKAVDELNKMKAAQPVEDVEKEQDLKQALIETLNKSDLQLGKVYEVKASTATIITPTYDAHLIPGVNYKRTRSLAFIPNFSTSNLGQDKNRLIYMDGTYSSNVGYVGEKTANSTEDTIAVAEKSRDLAKISAILKVSAELYEDKSYIANELQSLMYSRVALWLDSELYKGTGKDETGYKNKFYGLQTHAIAFDADKAGAAEMTEKATLTDLVQAIKTQGLVIDAENPSDDGGFDINLIFVNPVDAMIWRCTKDTSGQYLITLLSDGSQVMGGVRVVESTAVTAGTILAMESGLAELWIKRNFEIKVGQEDDDLSTDQYTIVLFLRAQSLVKDLNKNGIIYVSDIDTALTAITKVVEEAE